LVCLVICFPTFVGFPLLQLMLTLLAQQK